MNNTETIIDIPEYQTKEVAGLSKDRDIPYLKKDCFKYKERSPYEIKKSIETDQIEIKNTSYSGIMQLEKVRIHFSTKVKTNLFYMLSFLKDEKSFLYDDEIIIDIKEGESFFDIIGKLFLNELKEIFEKGFYKKYVRKEENISFLKGKLQIKTQVRNDIHKKTKFYCSYEDLTYDNLENRIVLRAATLLIPLIRFNEDIKTELLRYSYILKEEVSLVNVSPEDCNRVQFSKLNEHYETIIQFSKVILQNYFIRHIYKGASKGFNFIVNMNKVYEDFISQIVEEIIQGEDEFQEFVVEKQAKFTRLVKEGEIITKPDVILRKKGKEEYPLIIDAKYKREENNTDYYQVIAYALAIPTAKACCLIYPSEENVNTTAFTLDRKSFDNTREDVKLHTVKINLFWDEDMGFKEYIRKVKSELKSKLLQAIS
jgi:5-methylcytosine-specific restriction enzyme subunit McrC